jgi:Asp-tRNA(Asn)/Glu-tRNA(Gln) amidotransferase A subunit family amidase
MTSSALTATKLRTEIAAGRLTPERAIADSITEIQKRDNDIGAWVSLLSTTEMQPPRGKSEDFVGYPLYGIPIGLKDNIDTRDFVTAYGSTIYASHRPIADAACVSALRECGGVIVGKTALAEFAVRHPCSTRNPLNPRHTPGGSSSGSAAAVAANMVPLALGTQTGGSVIRPAAYCGINAIKPTFGLINRVGIKKVSDSADTIGFFARSIADLALSLGAVTRNSALVSLAFQGMRLPSVGVRLAFCTTPQWSAASPAMQQCFGRAEQAASKQEKVRRIELGQEFAGLDAAADTITEFETWQSLAHERLYHEKDCTAELFEVLDRGKGLSFDDYVNASKRLEVARQSFDTLFNEFDCIITPSAPDEAPVGLHNTGPSTFNKMWTLLHVPCVNVPAGKGSARLPLGLQVIAPRYRDGIALLGAEKLDAILEAAND